jgi:hypothetical protein
MKNLFILFLSIVFIGKTSCFAQQNKKEKAIPVGVSFNKESIKRIGAGGDNWCITWAKDGSQIVSMCDGNWLRLDNPHGGFHNHLFRITGKAENFKRRYSQLSGF